MARNYSSVSRGGSDALEWSPARQAHAIMAAVRAVEGGRESAARNPVYLSRTYHRQYLRATAHLDPSRASPLDDGSGTVVYYDPRVRATAELYLEMFALAVRAVRGAEADSAERWRSADWDARWTEIKAANRPA